MKDIDHIIDLMETGAELTDKELSMLQNDAQMRAVAEDIIIAQQVAASKNADADIDIEARLKAFKGRMDTKNRTSVIVHRLRWTAGIAAIAAGVVFFISQLMVPEQMDSVAESASKLLLTDDDGNVLPLTVHEEVGSVDPVIVAEEGVKSASHTTLDTLHLRIPRGSNYRLDLSDGSHVFLYPGASIVYPDKFGTSSRNIRLKGEAYFMVAKDSRRPFVITTDRSVTRVTGTEFHLLSNENGDESITLVNGKVNFSGINGGQSIDITPGQQVTIDKNGFLDVHPADTMTYTSWRDGFIYYDEERLETILKQIAQQYDIRVKCNDRALLDLRMHFVFRRDGNVNDAIAMLNRMKKINARLTNNVLIID